MPSVSGPIVPRRVTRLLPASHCSVWGWALLGALLGALCVTLWFAPARWLASAVQRVSGGQVELAYSAGRVWQGSAQLQVTGGAGSRDRMALPGRVHWQLRPGLRGVDWVLRADCCTPGDPLRVQVQPRWGGADVRLADGQSLWPAALLTGLGTPFNTLQVQGELALQTQGLSLSVRSGRVQLQGQARLEARQLSSRLSSVQPLGSYALTLAGGSAVEVQLQTLEGALQLSGTGQWVGQRLRFQGEASADAEHMDALANLLNLLGQRRGDKAIMVFN